MYIVYWTENGQAHYHRYGQKERLDYFIEHLKKTGTCINIAVTEI